MRNRKIFLDLELNEKQSLLKPNLKASYAVIGTTTVHYVGHCVHGMPAMILQIGKILTFSCNLMSSNRRCTITASYLNESNVVLPIQCMI